MPRRSKLLPSTMKRCALQPLLLVGLYFGHSAELRCAPTNLKWKPSCASGNDNLILQWWEDVLKSACVNVMECNSNVSLSQSAVRQEYPPCYRVTQAANYEQSAQRQPGWILKQAYNMKVTTGPSVKLKVCCPPSAKGAQRTAGPRSAGTGRIVHRSIQQNSDSC